MKYDATVRYLSVLSILSANNNVHLPPSVLESLSDFLDVQRLAPADRAALFGLAIVGLQALAANWSLAEAVREIARANRVDGFPSEVNWALNSWLAFIAMRKPYHDSVVWRSWP